MRKWITFISDDLLEEIEKVSDVRWTGESRLPPTTDVGRTWREKAVVVLDEEGVLTHTTWVGMNRCAYYPLRRDAFVNKCKELKPKKVKPCSCRNTDLLLKMIEAESGVVWSNGDKPTTYSYSEKYIDLWCGECLSVSNAPEYELVEYDEFVRRCAEAKEKK